MAVALRAGSPIWSLGIPSSIFNASGHAAGDIICVAACYFDTGATITISGFTSVGIASFLSADGTALCQLWWKLDGGSEPGSYSYTTGGGFAWADFVAFSLTGCNTSTPVAAHDQSGGNGTYSTGSVTVPSAGCFAVLPYCSFDASYTGPPDPLTFISNRGDSAAQLFGQAVSAGTLGPLSVPGATSNATVLAVFQPPGGPSLGTQLDEQRQFVRAARRAYAFIARSLEVLPPLPAPALATHVEFDRPRTQPRPSGALLSQGRVDQMPRLLASLTSVDFDDPKTPTFPIARMPAGRIEPIPPPLALLPLPPFDGPKTPKFTSTPLPLGRPDDVAPLLGLLPFQVFHGPATPKFPVTLLPQGRVEPILPPVPLLPLVLDAQQPLVRPRRAPVPTADAPLPAQAQAVAPPPPSEDREFVPPPRARIQRPEEILLPLVPVLPFAFDAAPGISRPTRALPARALDPLPVLVVAPAPPALLDERLRAQQPKPPLPLQQPAILPPIVAQAVPPLPLEDRLPPRRAARAPAAQDALTLPLLAVPVALPQEQPPRPVPAPRGKPAFEETPPPIGGLPPAPDERRFAHARDTGSRASFVEPVLAPLAAPLLAPLPELDRFARARPAFIVRQFQTVLPPLPPAVLPPWFDADQRFAWPRHRFFIARWREDSLPDSIQIVSYVAAAPDRRASLRARDHEATLLSRKQRRGSLH